MQYSSEIIGGLLAILLSIISYFLRILHRDVKENIRNTEANTANIKLLQAQQDGKIDKLAERTELQISQLADAVKTLTNTISHMNNNVKNTDVVLGLMIKKFKLDKE